MKIEVALQKVDVLAIETAPFIYYVENHSLYSDKLDLIFKIVEATSIKIVASTITLTETLVKPLKNSDNQTAKAYRELLMRHKSIQIYSVLPSIAEKAAELRANYILRTPDALHIATAIESHSDSFLTNDLGLKRITDLQILILDELEIK